MVRLLREAVWQSDSEQGDSTSPCHDPSVPSLPLWLPNPVTRRHRRVYVESGRLPLSTDLAMHSELAHVWHFSVFLLLG